MVSPKIEDRKENDLAYIEFVGQYDKVPWDELIPKLFEWAKVQKVMPGFFPLGIYYDDPKLVTPEKCRSEVGITFKGHAIEADGIKIKHLPAQKMATVSFKGPGSEYHKAYRGLQEWIEGKGHQVCGPCIEVYSKRPEIIDGVMILHSKIMMPLEPK
jgi:effector-binding domain-containing protein